MSDKKKEHIDKKVSDEHNLDDSYELYCFLEDLEGFHGDSEMAQVCKEMAERKRMESDIDEQSDN